MATRRHDTNAFHHEALFYAGQDEFIGATLAFIRHGLTRNERVLVAVSVPKVRGLRAALARDADRVEFADMSLLGRNPARIIPIWRDFVNQSAVSGRSFRGVGEPIWAERSAAELFEAQRHESLLNLAFPDAPPWRLLCTYDASVLEPDVLGEAARSHPWVMRNGLSRRSESFRGLEEVAAPCASPLPDPPGRWAELAFTGSNTSEVRHLVRLHARLAGLDHERADAVALAAHELAENSVMHGGGRGTIRVWREGSGLVCEVRDAGHITEPLWGRERPPVDQTGGRGAWLVNQLCDLVQVRSAPGGNNVRIRMDRRNI
ncbi:MAG: anti-sigma factor RsbA family regulatory protein [Candidatus Rokuibacteriota bacterium]